MPAWRGGVWETQVSVPEWGATPLLGARDDEQQRRLCRAGNDELVVGFLTATPDAANPTCPRVGEWLLPGALSSALRGASTCRNIVISRTTYAAWS